MIEWIQENYAEVFGALFAIYAAARAVVLLTPTKQDDKYVKRAGKWLEKIANIFGLDMNKGLKKK